ncbi:phosphoadenosine phosphosulfate reductase family protein [Desulforamulus putei]|uniref:3'-phosphoadenosine 5'-phosphosulfate sulfotransferase (PAPS reductase)/FAD synthetase n=1 Tax=Desulforamulus putei DSM 12395 TaxID=1121429 RepID=A0A1M4TYY9_9FIRM|nr:phosphoadenosine phosphosulfate reductase family protein [Desulforamulus putei]SHE49718.1 3'-phosphoadenosine 5'-phosphosulfate sulfotransferase (PAPS reductase)/FAD synthetase [Desulforamulus putei DSM 12395]
MLIKNVHERHILALSGGKDSAALAVYMREKYPHLPLEYVFTDSGCELPETYEYLDRIRAVLNIDITVIRPEKSWDSYWSLVKVKKTPAGVFTYLPSPKQRWCTEVLKLIPYEKWIESSYPGCNIISYVGLRADEKRERKGLISKNRKIFTCFPFIEDGLTYDDIKHLLEKSGLGFPAYYQWRKRSGCYFCFYQTKREWLGLYEHHPELYYKAMSYETVIHEAGVRFTWCDDMSLSELLERREEILRQLPLDDTDNKSVEKLSNILGKVLVERGVLQWV